MRFLPLFVCCAVLAIASLAYGWGNVSAHPAINACAFDHFMRSRLAGTGGTPKYAQAVIDGDATFAGSAVPALTGISGAVSVDAETQAYTIAAWLHHGGYSADTPSLQMALRHFYDPQAPAGKQYLTSGVPGVVNPEIDAKDWALQRAENPYTFTQALAAYRQGMEEPDAAKREAHFARAFRALGETMHLLADMAQPGHVRNDAHAWSEPLEDTVQRAHVVKYAQGALPTDVKVAGLLPDALFTTVARYTNTHFFSSDTVGAYPLPDLTALDYDEETGIYYASFPYADGPRRVALAMTTWLGLKTSVPSSLTDGQASVLVPIAVQANAELLDRFFPTMRLVMQRVPAGDGHTRISATLVHDIAADATWTAYGHQPIAYHGSGELVISSQGQERRVPVTFTKGVMDAVTIAAPADARVVLMVKAGGRIFSATALPFIITPATSRGDVGEFAFTAFAADLPKLARVEWNFGEKAAWMPSATADAGRFTRTHQYLRPGTFTVTARLIDGMTDTVAATATAQVVVVDANTKPHVPPNPEPPATPVKPEVAKRLAEFVGRLQVSFAGELTDTEVLNGTTTRRELNTSVYCKYPGPASAAGAPPRVAVQWTGTAFQVSGSYTEDEGKTRVTVTASGVISPDGDSLRTLTLTQEETIRAKGMRFVTKMTMRDARLADQGHRLLFSAPAEWSMSRTFYYDVNYTEEYQASSKDGKTAGMSAVILREW